MNVTTRLRYALAFLAILAVGWGPLAQAQEPPEPEPGPSTNESMQAEELERAPEFGPTEEVPSSNEATEAPQELGRSKPLPRTNALPAAPAPDGRTRRHERERRNRSQGIAQPSPAPATAASEVSSAVNGPASLDFSAFRLITERNIFDPNRMPHQTAGPRPPPQVIESFALVGTMSYGKGDFAFFDGTSSEYKKVLKASGTIAGYRIISIQPDSVKLARDTNQVVLAVGNQMRRQDGGPWVQAAGTGAYVASSSSSSASATTPASASAGSSAGGSASDILKRLMERRREQE